jgi:hypothetical protein
VLQRDGRQQLVAPGFQPGEVYDVLVANAAPELERREPPDSAAEVAAVLGVSRDEAECELRGVADDRDGLWSLVAAPAGRR